MCVHVCVSRGMYVCMCVHVCVCTHHPYSINPQALRTPLQHPSSPHPLPPPPPPSPPPSLSWQPWLGWGYSS